MRILILNTDYPQFLAQLYRQHPGLDRAPYQQQLQARNDTLFGSADFYPANFTRLGHQAVEIHINNRHLQLAWAKEHDLQVDANPHWEFQLRRGWLPWLGRSSQDHWIWQILEAQIRSYQPDVILSHVIDMIPASFWQRIRSCHRLLVGQVASPIRSGTDLRPFDLMISSLPNFVDRFRAQGLDARLIRLGFEPRVLELMDPAPRPDIDVSFIGSLSPAHADRIAWLEQLCRALDLKIWGPGVEGLASDSPIRRAYQGDAWGRQMYDLLRRSRITLNFHIGIAEDYANNMRLYEATGMGTLLVTDWKKNLAEIFEPGREIMAYRDVDHCIALARECLADEPRRTTLAAAGQARTLREHTYAQRLAEMAQVIQDRLQAASTR